MLPRQIFIRRSSAFFLLSPLLFFPVLISKLSAPAEPARSIPPIVMGCEGSLGENLFQDGDFGSGVVNIPQNDPGIAPGYVYARQGPPNDGLYVITNNTGAWTGLYPTWIKIRDNSDDPNGYMMVVNASYDPGIFYQQEITGLCANTTFEFSADVINLISTITTGHIKPNISFYINDELKFTSGDIPQDETWKTYGFTFTTGPDNSNLTLSIRNNAPGGIGNDLALDNISFRPCGPEAIILPEAETFVCVDDDSLRLTGQILNSNLPETFIQWQVSADGGATFANIPGETELSHTITNFSSGIYYYRFLIAGTTENLNNLKCRVFSYPKKVTVLPKQFTVIDTICAGQVYEAGSSSYTQSGIYLDTLISSFGCDSIVTLDLTVIADPMIRPDITVSDPSCYGIDDGVISLDPGSSGFPPFTYSLNDTLTGSIPRFEALSPSTYRLVIEDRFGCNYVDLLPMRYPEELTLDIGEDVMMPLGAVYNFLAITNYEPVIYRWEAPFEISCTDCPNPQAVAISNGVFTLEVINEAGCTVTDSLRFSIDNSESYRIFAPNAFSPNGDGINDRFNIFTKDLEVEAITFFQVFDRWGNLLFDQKQVLPDDQGWGWDGSFRNQPQDIGVYAYQFEVLFIDGTRRLYTGTISLVK